MRRDRIRTVLGTGLAIAAAAAGVALAAVAPAGADSTVGRAPQAHAAKSSAPVITSVSKLSKGVVTITGSGFTKVTAVEFGGVKSHKVKVLSSKKLTAVPPTEAPGQVPVIVVTKHGSSAKSKKAVYTYPGTPTRTVTTPGATVTTPGATVTTPGKTVTETTTQTTTVPTPVSDGTLSIIAGRNHLVTAGPATATPVYPNDVAVDSNGNLYIADDSNDVVEKVTPSGTLSIFAGIPGEQGTSVAGPATSTPLENPRAVAVNAAGDVYIADIYNDVVDEVTPSGTLSVIAGDGYGGAPVAGPATHSPLEYPDGLAVDPTTGDLYISDAGEHEIVRVTPSDQLSVVVGDGTSGFPSNGEVASTHADLNDPAGLAISSTGSSKGLYIADSGGDVVDKVSYPITAGTSTISIVAGSAGTNGHPTFGGAADVSQLDNPEGVALDSSGNLYIADAYNQDIEKVAAPANGSSTITAFAGKSGYGPQVPGPATSSYLADPYGVAADSTGNVYIADSENDSIDKVSAGILSVVTGFGPLDGTEVPGPGTDSPLDDPEGVAIDSSGDIFIADTDNDSIDKLTPSGTLSIVATGQFDDPEQLAVDSSDNLYVANEYDCEIDKIPAGGGGVEIIAGTGSCKQAVNGPALASPLDYPEGVAVDSSGNVYVADTDDCEIDKLTAGTLSIIAGDGTCGRATAGPALSSGLDDPEGVAVDSSGDVYIADTDNDEIDEVTPSGTLSIIAGGPNNEDEPVATPAPYSGLDDPEGIAVDAAGNIYVANTDDDYVERITPAGAVSVLAGNGGDDFPPSNGPALGSSLDEPEGVAVNPAGTELVIADTDNDDVEEVAGF